MPPLWSPCCVFYTLLWDFTGGVLNTNDTQLTWSGVYLFLSYSHFSSLLSLQKQEERHKNPVTNPEPERAALFLVLAHQILYLLGHNPSIYLSPRSVSRHVATHTHTVHPVSRKGFTGCVWLVKGATVEVQILNICYPLAGDLTYW